MLIKIPYDIWRDIFDFLSTADRRQLTLKFNKLGDREFSDLCQKWLHEWTKNICIGQLFIDSGDSKSARLRCWGQEFTFADTELPDNIRNFKQIDIRHLDTTVFNFMHRMRPILHEVNLDVYYDGKSLEATRIAFVHLLPLLSSGIECLKLLYNSSQLLFTIRDSFPSKFFAIKILELNVLNDRPIGIGEFVQLHLPWLSTRLADGQPRVLTMWSDEIFALELINCIRQRFLDATSPVGFFIRLWNLKNGLEGNSFNVIQDSISTNAETNEQLIIRKPEEEEVLHIGRCSSNLDSQTWVEEMDRRIAAEEQKAQRRISIYCLTDGSFEEELGANEKEEAGNREVEDPDQPGPSSKKPKLF